MAGEEFQWIGELTANGILAGVLIMLIRWLIQSQSHGLRQIDRSLARLAAVIVGLQSQLMEHDLTTVGLNPSDPGDSDARSGMVLRKYHDVQRQLTEIRQELSQLANGGADRD